MVLQTYQPDYMIELTKESKERQRTPYTYLVYDKMTSFTAFKTKQGLDYWLAMTGLSMQPLEHNDCFYKLSGAYTIQSVETLPHIQLGKVSPPNSIGWYLMFNGEYRHAIVDKVDGQHVITFEWSSIDYGYKNSNERLQKHIYLDSLLG